MELADWCDATVKLVEGRSDPVELAAVAVAARFWWLQNRVTEVAEAATRMATVVGDPEHHLSLESSATEAMHVIPPTPESMQRLHDALQRYGSEHPTWWTAQVAILLIYGGLDDSSVAPVIEQIGSPVLSAKFTMARAMRSCMDGEFGAAAELARQAAVGARAGGATHELAAALPAQGGCSARLADAATADVFAPFAESLELWDRLRVPWGRVLSIECLAAALAVRGHYEDAFVLWGASDACGIQAPPKVFRPGVHPYVAHVPEAQSARWYNRGHTTTLDRAVAYAREAVASILN
jgi:hypothetical protein